MRLSPLPGDARQPTVMPQSRIRVCPRGVPLSAAAFIAVLAVVLSLPVADWKFALYWHDSQRIGQVLVLVGIAALSVVANVRPFVRVVGFRELYAMAAIAIGGVLSTALAHQPQWAAVELALVFLSVQLAAFVPTIRDRLGSTGDRILVAAVVAGCAILAARAIGAYLGPVLKGAAFLDSRLVASGFDNPRFFGQFQTLTLPLLALPVMLRAVPRRYALAAGVLCVLWWMMSIASGTRGTWLGMGVAVALLSMTGTQGRRWASIQLSCAALGLLLYLALFYVVPDMLGLEVRHYAGDRLTSSLSARDTIWLQALHMIVARPWLGYGPMQFADIPNAVAAHPHQALLLWAAEWGLPSALGVAWLVWRGAGATWRVLRTQGGNADETVVLRVCLSASVAAALSQSMVDGVTVMPYSQLWLALLSGWLIALHPSRQDGKPDERAVPRVLGPVWRIVLIASAALLLWVVVRDVPDLQGRVDSYMQQVGGHLQPRFWVQGVIAEGAAD